MSKVKQLLVDILESDEVEEANRLDEEEEQTQKLNSSDEEVDQNGC